MKTKTQHTPTPWKFQGENIVNGSRDGNFAIFAKGEVIATAVGKADAAFIVRAVNSHEALLGLLKQVLNHTNVGEVCGGALFVSIKEAIAQAEGK